MYEYIWSNGVKPTRSNIKDNPNNTNTKTINVNHNTHEKQIYNNSKRDSANDKLNNRTLIASNPSNPFLINNNYIDDLENQANFLRPINNSNN